MKNKYNRLMKPFGDEGDFGGGGDEEMLDTQQQQSAEPSQVPTPPAGPSLDDIRAVVGETVRSVLPQHQPQQQMTPEERIKHFQIYTPTEDFVTNLFNPEATTADRMRALNDFKEGIVAQAFRAAELYYGQQATSLQQNMAPAVRYAQEQEQAAVMNAFETAYPSLKGQGDLINAIATQLATSGYKPESREAGFKQIAQTAEKILQRANPQFSLGNPQTGGGHNPRMAGTNMNNTGGHPQQRQQPQKRGQLADIWND